MEDSAFSWYWHVLEGVRPLLEFLVFLFAKNNPVQFCSEYNKASIGSLITLSGFWRFFVDKQGAQLELP